MSDHVITKKLSRRIRAAALCKGTPYPIKQVEGCKPPTLMGRSYYWTTPSGLTEVRHPGAYKWPTVYQHSTFRIEVGKDWITACLLLKEDTPPGIVRDYALEHIGVEA